MSVYAETPDPRSKMWTNPELASFDEILAVLLSHGTRRRNVRLLSQDIARIARTEAGLFDLDPASLTQIPGIGRSRAAVLIAATELGRRRFNQARHKNRVYIAEEVAGTLEEMLLGKPNEFFYLFTYNARFRLQNSHLLTQGNPDGVRIFFRDILKVLLNDRCSHFLLAHNHPEVSARASRADRDLVASLDELLIAVGIQMLDHFIVGIDGVFSCKRNDFIIRRGS